MNAKDIVSKEFDTVKRGGYDAAEVDTFLKDVSIEYKKMQNENEELEKKLEVLAEKIREYRKDEDALRDALLIAKKQGIAVVNEAKEDAEKIRKEAKEKADKTIKDADALAAKKKEISEKNARFSDKAVQELHIMEKAVSDIVEKAYSVFANQDMRAAEEIEPLEEVIDELSRELKRRHVNRLRAEECTIEMGFVLSDITTSLERIADHCSNIGVCVTQVHEDLYDTHSHLDTVKNAPGEHFHHELEVARVNYMLP